MVHELFLRKYGVEHLRNVGRIGITNNEASDVAEAGRERAGSAVKEGQKLNPFGVRAHLKKKPPISPRKSFGAVFGNLEFLKG